MTNKLLEAYVDGFEMAKEIFTGGNNVFGSCGVMKASALTARHAVKMTEYASMDANSKNECNKPSMQEILLTSPYGLELSYIHMKLCDANEEIKAKDARIKELESRPMSNEEINKSLADCEKLREMVADYEKRVEVAKNTIYELDKIVDNHPALDEESMIAINKWICKLDNLSVLSVDTYKCGVYKYKCTVDDEVFVGNSLTLCYNQYIETRRKQPNV